MEPTLSDKARETAMELRAQARKTEWVEGLEIAADLERLAAQWEWEAEHDPDFLNREVPLELIERFTWTGDDGEPVNMADHLGLR